MLRGNLKCRTAGPEKVRFFNRHLFRIGRGCVVASHPHFVQPFFKLFSTTGFFLTLENNACATFPIRYNGPIREGRFKTPTK